MESGISEKGTESKSRVSNQRTAFQRLAKRIISWALNKNKDDKDINTNVIRNYNESRDEVHDKASGLKMSYKEIVVAGNIKKMIDARRLSQ